MTTSNLPTEDGENLLRLNSAIKKLALAQAEHNEWKSMLPAIQERVRDPMDKGKTEMDTAIAAECEKYAVLTAGAQAFICETEQAGMDLEVKSKHLEAEVHACMAEACPEYHTTRNNAASALKGKAKPTMADIVGRHNDTEELEKDLQQAEKEWKEYKKAAMPPPKPMATWDSTTSKIRMYNISKLTDQCVEVLILEQHATEACYHLRKAKYLIFRTPMLCYLARASQHQFEPQPQLTLNRWKYEAEQAKTSEAKNYYQSLIKDYSNMLEQQKNSDEELLTDPRPAIAACQDTGNQHRCPASQMDAEVDSEQVAPAKRLWESVNVQANSTEDCPATDSSETE
ncbi:hypothetical protein IW147_004592, partial [Coemansia sp. RSA 720]